MRNGALILPQMLADGALPWDFLCSYIDNFWSEVFMGSVRGWLKKRGAGLGLNYGLTISGIVLRLTGCSL
jgi:hypothetical protein